MPILNERHIELLHALLGIFIEKLDADERFKNNRIKEWCKNMPTPPNSDDNTTDQEALSQIEEIHNYLVSFDAKQSAYGIRWPRHIVHSFRNKCELLRSTVESANVDQSIINLYHFHQAICCRSEGDFVSAIKHINQASNILNDYISAHPNKNLPRYKRNIALNKGHESDFFRMNGNLDVALEKAEEMLALAYSLCDDDEVIQLEKKNGFTPIVSWAFYHACVSHLAVDDWDNEEVKHKREFVFTNTFCQDHHLQWNVPTLIHILRNHTWKQRYPHYFEEIANRCWIGTADTEFLRIVRQCSLVFGRVRIRALPAVTAATAMLAIAIVYGGTNSKGSDVQKEDILTVVEAGIAEARPRFEDITDEDSELVKREISNEIEEFFVLSGDLIERAQHVVDHREKYRDNEESGWEWLAGPVNGNEQGVGPGIMVT